MRVAELSISVSIILFVFRVLPQYKWSVGYNWIKKNVITYYKIKVKTKKFCRTIEVTQLEEKFFAEKYLKKKKQEIDYNCDTFDWSILTISLLSHPSAAL